MRLREVEWFRPLIEEAQQWDYIVVWKLGNDPSRFIEWIGCCCKGVYDCGNVKEKKSEENMLAPLCRDDYLKHHVRTKSCKELAQLPTFMPLYSGVHTEVVISSQPRWLSHVDGSDSKPSHEDSGGTRALIPVEGGLIELYATKHIPMDQKVLELVLAHCNISLEQETMARNSCTNMRPSGVLHLNALTEQWPFTFHLLSSSPSLEALTPVTQSGSHTSIERLSRTSSSKPLDEHMLFDPSCAYDYQCEFFKQSLEKYFGSDKLDYNGKFLVAQACSISGHETHRSATKTIKKRERENYHSKNLHTERNRRLRIQSRVLTLRSLVPKITKMDKASTLGDAIDYIKELQKEEKELQDELKQMDEEDCHKNKDEYTISELDKSKDVNSYLPPADSNQGFSTSGPKKQTEVHVEVNQIGKKGFLVKLLCEQKQGGFVRLMEALDSLELQVVNANVTTFNGRVQNILEVMAEKDIQPKKLRDSLIELMS